MTEAADTTGEQLGGEGLLDVGRQDEDGEAGVAAAGLDRGSDALVGVRRGHSYVEGHSDAARHGALGRPDRRVRRPARGRRGRRLISAGATVRSSASACSTAVWARARSPSATAGSRATIQRTAPTKRPTVTMRFWVLDQAAEGVAMTKTDPHSLTPAGSRSETRPGDSRNCRRREPPRAEHATPACRVGRTSTAKPSVNSATDIHARCLLSEE